jgi:hypothetical protein
MGAACARISAGADDLFAYHTTRTLRIRDKRIGLTFIFIQLVILGYVTYQLLYEKQYLKLSPVVGITRLQVLRPSLEYRWPDQAAPYCLGSTNTAPNSYVNGGGNYKWLGPGGVASPQFPCGYWDEAFAVPDDLETNAVFLTTRVTVTDEYVWPNDDGRCSQLGHSDCGYNKTTNSTTYFIADAEYFTIYIDHNMAAVQANIARTSRSMGGSMVGPDNDPIDPCAAYASTSSGFNAPCPSFINVGVPGTRDIIAVQTLLEAAGIASLDQVAGTDPDLSEQTLRDSGLVLLLQIQYDNFFSFNSSNVQYTYDVDTVPNTEYKSIQTVTFNNTIPYAIRRQYNRHGIRIIITQSGRVGAFDFQTLLINLTVSLGLLSVAVLVTDFVSTSLCPQRAVYRQYKQRATVSFSTMKDQAAKELFRRFKTEEDLVDPLPPVFTEVVRATASRRDLLDGSGTPRSKGVDHGDGSELAATSASPGPSYGSSSSSSAPAPTAFAPTAVSGGLPQMPAATQRKLAATVVANPLAAASSQADVAEWK